MEKRSRNVRKEQKFFQPIVCTCDAPAFLLNLSLTMIYCNCYLSTKVDSHACSFDDDVLKVLFFLLLFSAFFPRSLTHWSILDYTLFAAVFWVTFLRPLCPLKLVYKVLIFLLSSHLYTSTYTRFHMATAINMFSVHVW